MNIKDIDDVEKMAALGRKVAVNGRIKQLRESMRDCAVTLQTTSDAAAVKALCATFLDCGNELIECFEFKAEP